MKFDWTNAERQRRHRAKKKEEALRNTQAIEKPQEVTPKVTPRNALKKCPPYNPPINYTNLSLGLFPESPLSLQEKTSARARFQSAVLIKPFEDYGLRWGPNNPTVEDVEGEFEAFKGHWGSYLPHDSDAEVWPMWQSWVQRWRKRETKPTEVGSIPWQIQQKERTLATLKVLQGGQNGTVQRGDGEQVRGAVIEGVAYASQSGHKRVGQGGHNPPLQLLGRSGSGGGDEIHRQVQEAAADIRNSRLAKG